MRVLFGGPLSPVGWTVGCLRLPFAVARDATRGFYEAHQLRTRDERLTHGAASLLELMRSFDPLQTPPKKALVVATDCGWTLHLQNNHLGGDSVSWVSHLAREHVCEGIIATHIPEGQYPLPCTQLQLFGPAGVPPLGYVRTISAGKHDSGRWEFAVHGEAQPFEECERYSARRVRDRFDLGMLLRYLSAKGLDVERDGLFTDATLFVNLAEFRSRESSIADTRRQYGVT